MTEEEIAEVVSKWTAYPVSKMMEGEKEKLLQMEEAFHQRLIGQNEASQKLSPMPFAAHVQAYLILIVLLDLFYF